MAIRPPEFTRAQGVEWYLDRFMSTKDIAEKTGLNTARVLRVLKGHGIPIRRTGFKLGTDKDGRRKLKLESPHKFCRFILDNGERCPQFALKGHHFCRMHLVRDKVTEYETVYKSAYDWARTRRLIDGKPFSLTDFPFLEEPYKSKDPYEVIMKGSQIGISEYAINKSLWFCETGRGNVIYTLPDDAAAEEFSQMRFGPVFADNPDLMGRKIVGEKGAVDRIGMKQVGDKFVFIRGTYTKRRALTIPSDFNIHDELDHSKPSVIKTYFSRLGNSRLAWRILLGTPTSPNVLIHKAFMKTNQKHWCVKCTGCGKWVKLCCGYPHLITRGKGGNGKLDYRCDSCHAILNRRKGRFIPDNPKGKATGRHISRLCSPKISAERLLWEMVEEYDTKVEAYNQALGLPRASDEIGIGETSIADCEDARLKVVVSVSEDVSTWAGMDQGGTFNHIIIGKTSHAGKAQLIFADEMPLDLAFSMAENYMRQFRIRCLIVDYQPNIASARKLAQAFNGRVWMHEYKWKLNEEILWKPQDSMVYTIHSESLDKMYEKIIMQELAFPPDKRFSKMKRHLQNLIPQYEKDKHGKVTKKYIAQGPDHFAHTLNYALIARGRDVRVHIRASKLSELGEGPEHVGARETVLDKLIKKIPRDLAIQYIQAKEKGLPTRSLAMLGLPRVSILVKLEKYFSVEKILEKVWPLAYNGDRKPKPKRGR